MKVKKIAVIYQGARHYGGIETYLEQLFSNIDKSRFSLTLVSLGEWELAEKLIFAKERVIKLPFRWFDFPKLWQLKKLYEDEEFDLVVSQGLVANFYARISAYIAKVPNLVTIHSNYDYDFHGPKKFLYWLTFKLFGFMTTKYIVVSKYLKEQTRKNGVKPAKISVVYNGLEQFPAKIKKRKQEVVIGTIGRLHYAKGFHNLIQAIKILEQEKIQVLIWGTGEEEAGLRDLIKREGLIGKVKLMGFATDLPETFSQIDIYTQPSLSEGFGMTVVEAMIAEKPILVTPAGALKELIADGQTGLMTTGFTPEVIAASLRVLISDEKLAIRLAKEARKDALARFSIESWIKETEKIYAEVIK